MSLSVAAKSLSHLAEMLSTSSPASEFPPKDMGMEVPLSLQLMLASVLLLIFGAAVGDVEGADSSSSKESEVKLVKVDSIAFRFAAAISLLSLFSTSVNILQSQTDLVQMLLASPREGFNPMSAEVAVPVGIQLLLISVLFAIFAAAISDTDNRPKETGEEGRSQVELVRVNSIAFRIAGAVGLIGLCGTLDLSYAGQNSLMRFAEMLPISPRQGFNPASVEVGVEAGIQLLLISILFVIFAAAIWDTDRNSEEADNKGKPPVELVKASRIAVRMAGGVGLLGLCRTCSASSPFEALACFLKMLPASPAKGFAPASAELEVSAGVQLFLVSALLLVFAAVVRNANQPDCTESDKQEMQPVGVTVSGMAVRLAASIACLGALMGTCDGFEPRDFPLNEAELNVPSWALCLLTSALLFVFGILIKIDDSAMQSSQASTVAVALGSIGACGAMISAPGVWDAATSSEMMVNGGLLILGTAIAFSDSRARSFLLGAEK